MEPLIKTIYKFLYKTGIHINFDELSDDLQSHPDYPSAASIVATLYSKNIELVGTNLSWEDFEENGGPVLVVIKDIQEHIALVSSIGKKQVKLIDYYTNVVKKISIKDFQQIWTGNAIYLMNAKIDNAIKYKSWFNHFSKYIIPILLMIIMGGCYLFFQNNVLNLLSNLLFISFAGLLIGIGILMHEFKVKNKFIEKVCSTGKKTDCSAVLESKGSNFFYIINLSDLVISYFITCIGLILITFINPFFLLPLNFLWLTSAISLLYIFYSFYYQFYIIKKICPLCLSICAILLIMAAVLFCNYIPEFHLSLVLFSLLLGGPIFIFILIIVMLFRNNIEEIYKLKSIRKKYLKIVKDKNLFDCLLEKNNLHNLSLPENEIIVDPKGDALFEITGILSFSCGACGVITEKLIQLKEKYGENIQVNFCFITNTEDKMNPLYKITKHMYGLYFEKRSVVFFDALRTYMKNTNFEYLKENYPVLYDEKFIETTIEKRDKWIQENQIYKTPTIILNGSILSNIYDIENLDFFIKETIDL